MPASEKIRCVAGEDLTGDLGHLEQKLPPDEFRKLHKVLTDRMESFFVLHCPIPDKVAHTNRLFDPDEVAQHIDCTLRRGDPEAVLSEVKRLALMDAGDIVMELQLRNYTGLPTPPGSDLVQ